MNRPRLKSLVVGAVVLVGLPLLLLAFAWILVPRDALVQNVVEQVTAATGATMQPGEVSLKVVGGLGLTLTGGRIVGEGTELRRRTGAGKDIGAYDLEYSRLDVSLDLAALLRRQVAVNAIRLVGPALAVEVSGDPLRLSDYDILITEVRLDLTAPIPAGGAAPGQRIPQDLSFGLRIAAAEFLQRGTPWQMVKCEGAWAARHLKVAVLSANLGAGQVRASGALDYAADPWGHLTWTAELVDVPAEILLPPYLPDLGQKLVCDLSGEVSGGMALRDTTTRLQSLTVTGRLGSGEGVLYAEDWLHDVSRYLGSRQDLKTVNFGRLDHEFRVTDGRYLIDSLQIDGRETDWQATGWLGFAGDLGLTVGVRLPVGFTPDLGAMSFVAETLRDDEGRVNLGLKLSGRTAAPTVGLDLRPRGRSR